MALTDLIDLDLLSRFKGKIDTLLAGKSDTGHKHAAGDITSGTLAVAKGGTGASDEENARINLDVLQRYSYYTTDSGSAKFYVKTTIELPSSSYLACTFQIIITYGSSYPSATIIGVAYWTPTGFASTYSGYYDALEAVKSIKAINSDGVFYLEIDPKGTYQYYNITVGTTSMNINYVDSISTTAPTIDYSKVLDNTSNLSIVNMMPPIYYRQTQSGNSYTTNGITWTVNANGSITATGTATDVAYYQLSGVTENSVVPPIYLNPKKTYMISGCPSVSTSSSNVYIGYRATAEGTTPSSSSGTWSYCYSAGKTISGMKYLAVYCCIAKNYNCGNGVTFYPMLEYGANKHAYVNVHDVSMHLS